MKTRTRQIVAALGLLLGSLTAAQAQSAGVVTQPIDEIVVATRSPAAELAEQLSPWLNQDLDTRLRADIGAAHDVRYADLGGIVEGGELQLAERIARQWQRWVGESTL